ncbi:MAG: DNA helicase RecQ [Bacteroidia bacterium]
MIKSNDLLRSVFGFSEFRGKQQEIISHILEGKDSLAIMPTGAGKSLCFQLPALSLPGLTVVISPLIALMKDQIDGLRSNGVQARSYNSNVSEREKTLVLQELKSGQLKLLYLSPERLFLQSAPFIEELKKHPLSLFAIDEAHCISHWGHDFREDYLTLGQLRTRFPEVPIIALTATADVRTRQDILEKLHIPKAQVFLSSFDRPNIYYRASYRADLLRQLDSYLENKKEECGIIYCLARKDTEKLAESLNMMGYNALAYHAGMEKRDRDQRQDLFKNDQMKIIVATIAFGMGIDKPNVRFVIHACLPKNMESYYQETGRAGRDGLPSEALLLHTPADFNRLRFFIYNSQNEKHKNEMLQKLEEMAQFAETSSCRRKNILNYFDEQTVEHCNHCDNCAYESAKATAHSAEDGLFLIQVLGSLRTKCTEDQLFKLIMDSGTESLPSALQIHPLRGKGKNKALNVWEATLSMLKKQDYVDTYKGDLRVTHMGMQWKASLERAAAVTVSTKPKTAAFAEEELRIRNALKEWRVNRAKAESVPAYIVFNDATLEELVTKKPYTLVTLNEITGFGELKVERYGKEILCIIREIGKDRILEQARFDLIKIRGSKNAGESFFLFKRGHKPEEIAEKTGYALNTIYRHLEGFVFDGELDPHDLLRDERIREINKVLDEYGLDLLSSIKERLPEEVDYREIGIVRANWIKKHWEDMETERILSSG